MSDIKIIDVFADYSSSGLWDGDTGYSLDLNDIPISELIKDELKRYQWYFDTESIDFGYNSKDENFIKYNIDFVRMAFNIALMIKLELPHLVVRVYDEDEIQECNNPDNIFSSKYLYSISKKMNRSHSKDHRMEVFITDSFL